MAKIKVRINPRKHKRVSSEEGARSQVYTVVQPRPKNAPKSFRPTVNIGLDPVSVERTGEVNALLRWEAIEEVRSAPAEG